MEEYLGIAERCFGEGEVQDASLAGVHADSGATPGVDRSNVAWPDLVVDAFLDVALWAEYSLVGGGGVEDDSIWGVAEFGAYGMDVSEEEQCPVLKVRVKEDFDSG